MDWIDPRPPTHVVAIGGSAGSLEALESFFAGLPAHCRAAFIVVTHRDPRSKGLMASILARFTSMQVRPVEHGDELEADTVYVVPVASHVDLRGRRFEVTPRAPLKGRPSLTIDEVFSAVAREHRATSVGILLSGMGSDGTLGLSTIRKSGGISMVQTPESAGFDAMPLSAIQAGAAELVCTPASLATNLVAYLEQGRTSSTDAATIAPIIAALTERTGHDFSPYKASTVRRRIERRMNVMQVFDVGGYVALLEAEPAEADRLFDDLLIGVTSFFRDPQMFEALEASGLPQIGAVFSSDRPLRVWVAGCATGEEAYSFAILLREYAEKMGHQAPRIQIYATDLDKEAIDHARQGVYPVSIEANVSRERLDRFFVRDEGTYRIKKDVRDSVVFATQNLVADPPFTKLHILSCRNVLIYLNADIQRKLLPVFFHALAPGGLLVLGTSESIGGSSDSFTAISSQWKIFQRTARPPSLQPRFDLAATHHRSADEGAAARVRRRETSLSEAIEREIIDQLVPPVLVIDAKGNLVYSSQATGSLLEMPSGKPSANVFAMARGGLNIHIRQAVRKALARRGRVVERDIRLRKNGHAVSVDLRVLPLRDPQAMRGLIMVAIEETAAPSKSGARTKTTATDRTAASELRRAREQLQAVLVEMEHSQEELRSTNEELQSTNEELQSTNEELTTSKEEMQSMNEELLTLNAELQSKNEELVTTNDDMRNLLNSSQIPTLFLDNELRLKRYTAQAGRIANLIPGDVGRPITDIRLHVRYDALASDVRHVLETLVFKEVEVEGKGAEYTMRIHPYRTMDNVIDGVVITFLDVTALKRAAAQGAAQQSEALLRRFIRDWPGVAYVEDGRTGRSLAASSRASLMLGYSAEVLDNATREFWRALRPPSDREAVGSFRIQATNGIYRWFDEDVTELTPRDGSVSSLVLHVLHPRDSKGDEG